MKSYIKNIAFTFTFLIVILLLVNNSFAADSNKGISGKISLPEGMLANQNITLFLYAQNCTSEDEYYEYSTSVIPEGSDSVTYSIDAFPNSDYKVSFLVDNNIAGLLGKGYYSVNGTVSSGINASLIHLSDEGLTNIDLQILEGTIIEGTLSLPAGSLAPENGLEVLISAFNDNGTPYELEDDYEANAFFTIPQGKNSVKYFITAAPSKVSGYIINYYIFPESRYQYLYTGYYSVSCTTFNKDDATSILPDKDRIENVNLTILKGTELKVTFTIPENISMKKDFPVSVAAFSENGTNEDFSDDYYYEKEIIIPQGIRSFSTTIYVASGLRSGYILSYSFENDLEGYLPSAYYGKNSMVSSMTKAFPVTIGNAGKKEIKMTFLKGIKVSGILTLGHSSNNASVKSITIVAESNNNTPENYMDDLFYCTNVTIPEGKNSVPYEIYVAPDQSYNLFYYQFDSPDYNSTGYYSKKGTVLSKESSDKLPVKSMEFNRINFKIK